MKKYILNDPLVRSSNEGFTIIELMIATAVFTVILLIVTVAVIDISKLYIRGQVQSQTQDTARSLLATISQDIEFTKSSEITPSQHLANSGDNFYFCVGSHVYEYTLDSELNPTSFDINSSDQYTPHDLILSSSPTCSSPSCLLPSCVPNKGVALQRLTSSSQELLSVHQRLGQLDVEPVSGQPGTYTIKISIGYGDDSVLQDVANSGPRIRSAATWLGSLAQNYNYNCVPQSFGGQFCAVSTLTTTVTSRIN